MADRFANHIFGSFNESRNNRKYFSWYTSVQELILVFKNNYHTISILPVVKNFFQKKYREKNFYFHERYF